VDHADWVNATGSWIAGRGGYRPINPKLLPQLTTKAAQLTAKPSPSTRAYRRLVLTLAQASLHESRMLAAAYRKRHATVSTMAPALWVRCQPGMAGQQARARHTAAVQRLLFSGR
jgi:hypothetical protein